MNDRRASAEASSARPGLAARVALLFAAAAVCGTTANLVSPRRIPWVEDWSEHIEALALKAGVPLVSVWQMEERARAGLDIIFDARPAADYALNHIPGSLSLPHEDVGTMLDNYIAMLTPAQPITTYCSGLSCDDALLLAVYLREQGFTNTALYAGGWEEWSQARRAEAAE